MSKPLSPAAQAVIDAMSGVYAMDCPTAPVLPASVIRAVAAQLFPLMRMPDMNECDYASDYMHLETVFNERKKYRAELLAIAAELEATNA